MSLGRPTVQEKVLVEGLLWKRDRGKRLLKAVVGVRWQLRWFRIVEGRDELEWYHDSGEIESRAPCGTMALSDRVVELVPRADANGRMNCFALRRRENGRAQGRTRERNFQLWRLISRPFSTRKTVAGEMVLAATSAPDVANWLEALMYVTRGAGGPTMLERCRSESLRSTLSRPSLFVDDAGAGLADDVAAPPRAPPTPRRPETPRTRSLKTQAAYLASAEGQFSTSLAALAKKAKVLAERSVPASLRSYYAPLDRGVAVVKDMAEDGRLSDAGARALLVEVALQNREVVAAVRDADEERLEALALKIKEINACQDHLVGRREKGKRASHARFSLYAGAAEAVVLLRRAAVSTAGSPAAGDAARGARRRVRAPHGGVDAPARPRALRAGRAPEAIHVRARGDGRRGDGRVRRRRGGRLRSLDGEESDEDYSEEESDDDDDDDAEWPPAWRYPRETFQDDGAIPPEERARLLAASGHRRVSISLNAAQLLAIAQSRKRNSRARAARRIIDGDDPDGPSSRLLLLALTLCGGTPPYPPGTDHGWTFRHTKANFIDAYGGNLTTFAYLKLEDERGSVLEDGVSAKQGVRVGDTTRADLSSVLYALRHIGVDEARMDLVLGNHSAPAPACGDYRARHDGLGVRDSLAYYKSLLGQIENRKKCYDMVVAHESLRASPRPSYSRPDLAWPFPIVPWCAHNYFTNRKKQDWIWWLTRADAKEALSRPHDDMYGCRRELKDGQTVEDYFYTGQRNDFWYPGGRGDHAQLSGHIVRVPSVTMGATMCKQFVMPGIWPAIMKDEAPRGWNCGRSPREPYNHPNCWRAGSLGSLARSH
ncbi:hypothetical protein JL722_15197 [Aureococcus anophagefferens]|nr:hypothetical protein JL722_15197 [Aureococcus anophagefferens]